MTHSRILLARALACALGLLLAACSNTQTVTGSPSDRALTASPGGQIPCSDVIANCTRCGAAQTVWCQACASGFGMGPHDASCMACSSIDPQCTTCNQGLCTACKSGYGTSGSGTSCIACSSIDPQCTTCNQGLCTACASGYGTSLNQLSCIACNSLDPNCATCSEGQCTSCTAGMAVNSAGQCVQTGNSQCPFNVGGVCCKCQYSCQDWNSASTSCAGAPMNGCHNGICAADSRP